MVWLSGSMLARLLARAHSGSLKGLPYLLGTTSLSDSTTRCERTDFCGLQRTPLVSSPVFVLLVRSGAV